MQPLCQALVVGVGCTLRRDPRHMDRLALRIEIWNMGFRGSVSRVQCINLEVWNAPQTRRAGELLIRVQASGFAFHGSGGWFLDQGFWV